MTTYNAKDNLAVALTKTQCPYCAEIREGDIVMNTRLTKHCADQVNEVHGKVTSLETCSRYQEALDSGAVFLVEIDPEKSVIKSANGDIQRIAPDGAYRTGRLWAITEVAYKQAFTLAIPPDRMVFIDPEVSEKLGFNETTDSPGAA